MSSSEPSSSDNDWNGQTPIEFWASFGLAIVSFVTILFWVPLWKNIIRHRLLRQYRRNGVLVQAAVVDSKFMAGERRSRNGNELLARHVKNCSVTIEYDAPQPPHSDREITDHIVLHRPIVGSSEGRLRKTITSEGRLLYVELLRVSRGRDDAAARESDGEDAGQYQDQLEVLVLPGHPQSAYPQILVENDPGDGLSCQVWVKLACLVVIMLLLFGTSVTLQCRKEKWDVDYDIAPFVWMIVTGEALLLSLVMLAINNETKTSMLKNATLAP